MEKAAKIIPLLFLVVGVVLIFRQQIPQLATHLSEQDEGMATTSFAYACTSGPDARCEWEKLGDVLSTRALTPEYKKYTDTQTGVSFEYPSFLSFVEKEQRGDKTIYKIQPLMPAPVYTEYWSGSTIVVEKCGENCPTDLKKFLYDLYSKVGGGTLVDEPYIVTKYGRQWMNFYATQPIGSQFWGLVLVDRGRLIYFTSDVGSSRQTLDQSLILGDVFAEHPLRTLNF